MNPLNKRIFFVLIALGFFVAAILVYSLFIKPSYVQVSALRAEYGTKNEALLKYQTSVDQLSSVFDGYSDSQQLQENVSRALPSSRDTAYVSAQIIGFAKLNRLQIESLSIEPGQIRKAPNNAIKSVGTISIQLIAKGGYGDFKSFIRQLENNLLLFDVESLSTVQEREGAATPSLRHSLKIRTYYQTQ